MKINIWAVMSIFLLSCLGVMSFVVQTLLDENKALQEAPVDLTGTPVEAAVAPDGSVIVRLNRDDNLVATFPRICYSVNRDRSL